MPQLHIETCFSVRPICRILFRYLYLKLHRVSERPKIYIVVGWTKYGGFMREISVVGIVQGVLDEVSDEHLDTFRRSSMTFEIIRCYHVVLDIIAGRVFERNIRVIVQSVE